jgi:hypothetical protein
MCKIHNITQPTNMLQPKLKQPGPFLVPAPVLLMALFILLPAFLTPAACLITFSCISIGVVTYILSNSAVYFKQQSSFDNRYLLAIPFCQFISFILPLRPNAEHEEAGPDAFRFNRKCLPGQLPVRRDGAMKERLLEE